jgi:hypothetical protein
MNLIFYSSEIDGKVKKLFDSITSIIPDSILDSFNSIKNLSKHLSKPTVDMTFALFLASNMNELVELYSLKNLLEGIQLILIIPNMKEETIKYGHLFYPRYLDFLDSDFVNLGLFVKRMVYRTVKSNSRNLIQKYDNYKLQHEGN